MKIKLSNLSLIALLILLSSLPSFAFKFSFFKKNDIDQVPVTVLNLDGCPIEITNAKVEDIGTDTLKHKKIEFTYSADVHNKTDKDIQAVQLLWLREIPFEPYLARKFKVNSVDSLSASGGQKITFKLSYDDRQDSYFSVWVKKVLFTDGEEWLSQSEDKATEGIPVIETAEDLERSFETQYKHGQKNSPSNSEVQVQENKGGAVSPVSGTAK